MNYIYPDASINTSCINTEIQSKVLWMTGLSGSGKSTIANVLQQILTENGIASYILDGDNIRNGLNFDLTFKSEDRKENIRRIAEVSKLFKEAGIIVITSFISPYEETRQMAKDIIGDDYIEVYINASLSTCIDRDVKGLYEKAIAGEIPNFTGISDKFEVPKNADLTVNANHNTNSNIGSCAMEIYEYLVNNN